MGAATQLPGAAEMNFCEGSMKASLVILFFLAVANALERSHLSYHASPPPSGFSPGPPILSLPELPQVDLQQVSLGISGNGDTQTFQEA